MSDPDAPRPEVLCHREDGVAVLTFNRPDRMNGWTAEMERRYFDHLAELGDDDGVRAIVVTGAGRAFCAGADMAHLERLGEGSATLPPASDGCTR
jgi:enoyl-CoA hydratase/carnithine racemase